MATSESRDGLFTPLSINATMLLLKPTLSASLD